MIGTQARATTIRVVPPSSRALITITGQKQPPRRFIAGADAIAIAEQKVANLQQQINAYRDLSTSLALDYA